MKKKRQQKVNKTRYRVRNWAAYNQSLVQRGAITLWISEDVLANWHPEVAGRRERGGQMRYSDQAIECLLMLKAVYRLPYRQTIGLGQSVLGLLGAEVSVPDYTTLCKRSAEVKVEWALNSTDMPKHIVVDSTGLKVYGEGEWKVRMHGFSKHRIWRKLHLSIDESNHEIQAVVLTEAGVDDAEAGKQLLDDTVGTIEQLSGDGSYDKVKFYDACQARRVKCMAIPPRRTAKISQHGNCKNEPLPRDQNLRRIRQVGRKRWKIEIGYHRRSLAETAVFRFKTIFGNTLSSRTLHRQITEACIKVVALNRMTHLGMPDSYRLD